MGQATLDLPDPLDAPPPSSLSGTDDLLAQLAGDEIDRLLAEADGEQKSPGKAPQAPADPVPAQPSKPTPAAEPNFIAAAESTPIASADAAIAASAPGDDELDALLSQLEEDAPKFLASPSPVDASEPATAPIDGGERSLVDRVPEVLAQFPTPAATIETPAAPTTDAAAAIAIPVPEPVDAGDGVMSAAERDALKIAELAESDAPGSDTSEDARPGRLTAPLIKLLEVLNAPMSFVPDALRDTLGKVAIVTLVNSIAVLIYVLFLRH